jgi:uncharacterized protein
LVRPLKKSSGLRSRLNGNAFLFQGGIMKIVIPGGSGQVGMILSRAFHKAGHEVVVFSRKPNAEPWRVVAWDSENAGDWQQELEGAEVVINLAGRSVNCRYNPENRRLIKESRVNSTRLLGAAIAGASQPPRLWLQASTATIYAHRYDAPNDETTGIIGGDEANVPDTWRFSIDVATSWERALNEAVTPRTRKVLLRSAITLSPDHGGAFEVLLNLARRGLGGTAGDGRQYVSWIHDKDFTEAIFWLIEHEEISGAVNLASPRPLPNREFMRILRAAAGVALGLPASRWMLELGAIFLQTETELILKSRRVVPQRLLDAGFRFQFPDWSEAARDLCDRWRKI